MDEMIAQMATQWLGDGLYAVGAFGAGAAATWIKMQLASHSKLERGMRELLKSDIRRLHEQTMKQGYITYEQLDAAQKEYAVYHDINGNGAGTAMVKDMEALPLHEHRKEKVE